MSENATAKTRPSRPRTRHRELPPVPLNGTVDNLKEAAKGCRGCDLYKDATQVVFGEGAVNSPILFVSEQPGDQEDHWGRPFVGPAGKLLRAAIEEAGLDIASLYFTNAVKHFKWKAAGRVRLHQKPTLTEVRACRPWLEAEIHAVRPRMIVALGITAGTSLLGVPIKIGRDRGKVFELGPDLPVFITAHPSSILRQPTDEDRAEAYRLLVADLGAIKTLAPPSP